MNPRERLLLSVLLGILIVGGGGAAFYYAFLQDYLEMRNQVQVEDAKLTEKQSAVATAEKQQAKLLTLTPRLELWKELSLPDLPSAPGGPKTHTPAETAAHLNKWGTQYQMGYLDPLLLKHGFTAVTIRPQKPIVNTGENRAGTPDKNKVTLFTRLSFSVQAQANYDQIVDMLRAFYSTQLLHEVRSLNITRPSTPRQDATSARQREALDVNMTVEVLMVSGTPPRTELIPKHVSQEALHVLAEPGRHYTDMIAKNPFFGTRPPPPPGGPEYGLKEPAEMVLKHVRLTMIAWNERRRFWEATFFDQGKALAEKTRNERTLTDLTIFDKFENTVFDGKVAHIEARHLVLEQKGKYYLMSVGDVMDEAMKVPLKDSELEKYNIKPKKVAATTSE